MYNLGSVTLRKMTEDDLEEVRLWRNNPKVRMKLVNKDETSTEQQKQWWSTRDFSKEHYFILERKGKKFGLVYGKGFTGTQIETGIFVAPEYMGLPYGLAGAYALILFCFDILNVEKIVASHYPDNTNVTKSDAWFGYLVTHEDSGLIWSELTRERYLSCKESVLKVLEKL